MTIETRILTACLFFALASCVTDPTPAKNVAAAAASPSATPRATELRVLEIHSQPEGAAIYVNGQGLGYAPVSLNVTTYVDDGSAAYTYSIYAIPTGPGQYQQRGLLGLGLQDLRTFNRLIFYMYNNLPNQ